MVSIALSSSSMIPFSRRRSEVGVSRLLLYPSTGFFIFDTVFLSCRSSTDSLNSSIHLFITFIFSFKS